LPFYLQDKTESNGATKFYDVFGSFDTYQRMSVTDRQTDRATSNNMKLVGYTGR